MTVELIDGRADPVGAAMVVSDVLRWLTVEPDTIEQIRATVPTHRDWLGLLDGKPVGFASCSVPSRRG